MLDPREQKKGGFGAFAERQRDRAELPATAAASDAQRASPTTTPADPDAQADGVSAPEPHRQRFFRGLR